MTMTDAHVLALLAVQGIRSRAEAVSLLIWAKTEGMADVDRAVTAWYEAKRAKEQRPRCATCYGLGSDRRGPGPCPSCEGTGREGGPTYEENHIRYPSGEPRP